MSDMDIVLEADVCREVLNGLIAAYMRFSYDNNVDLRDENSEICSIYKNIVLECSRTRFYHDRQDIEKCNEIIDFAKEYLEKIGGTYL
ncbi:MAG: hypothetical protein NC300_01670 [Bacteroidales bacterium]|nr:hypothetical protein [Clostridium sp.]MCM1202834.1 hypothetical protein [Bacteroidales bacterium]